MCIGGGALYVCSELAHGVIPNPDDGTNFGPVALVAVTGGAGLVAAVVGAFGWFVRHFGSSS